MRRISDEVEEVDEFQSFLDSIIPVPKKLKKLNLDQLIACKRTLLHNKVKLSPEVDYLREKMGVLNYINNYNNIHITQIDEKFRNDPQVIKYNILKYSYGYFKGNDRHIDGSEIPNSIIQHVGPDIRRNGELVLLAIELISSEELEYADESLKTNLTISDAIIRNDRYDNNALNYHLVKNAEEQEMINENEDVVFQTLGGDKYHIPNSTRNIRLGTDLQKLVKDLYPGIGNIKLHVGDKEINNPLLFDDLRKIFFQNQKMI